MKRMRYLALGSLAVLALALAPAGVQAAGPLTLYGTTTTGSTGPSDLYEIDIDTGVATLIGPVGFDRVGAIDRHPVTGVLYAMGQRPADDTPVLITIDPTTGAGTEIGPTGTSGAMADISFRLSDNTLFAYNADNDPQHTIYTVNIGSGAAAALGDPGGGKAGNGLAFSAGGVLYNGDHDSFHVVNQGTGTYSSSTPFNYPPLNFPRPGAMDFHPLSGRLYALIKTNDGEAFLGTIDVATADVTLIGDTGVGALDGLTFGLAPVSTSGFTVLASSTANPTGPSSLYEIDINTGAASLIGAIGFNRVGAMDRHPYTGAIYATGRRPADGVPVLLTIDPATGAGSEVAPTGFPGDQTMASSIADLSFRPSDFVLYALHAWSDPDHTLFTINPANGATTLIGDVGIANIGGNGIAFSPSEVLWHATEANTYTLDQTNGASNQVAPLLAPAIGIAKPAGLDYHPSAALLYGIFKGASATYFGILNAANGHVLLIGDTGVPALDGLVFGPPKFAAGAYDAFATTTAGPDGASDFYRVDLATGAAALVGPIGFDRVSGLDMHPVTGVLYATGRRPADGAPVLIRIDPLTGAGTEVGPTGIAGTQEDASSISDLSFRGTDFTLYGHKAFPGNHQVFTFDANTGAATLIGNTGVPGAGNGTAFAPDHRLLLATDLELFLLDQNNGAGAVLVALTYPPGNGPRAAGMDFHPLTDRLYAIVKDFAPDNYLAVINTTTGAVTKIGSTGVQELDGLVIARKAVAGGAFGLYASSTSGPGGASSLYAVDPDFASTTLIGPIGFNRVGAIDTHPQTGVIYGTGRRPADGVSVLITIDPTTGAGTEVGPTNLPGAGDVPSTVSDLSFRGDGALFLYHAANDPQHTLFRVNLVTGNATLVGETGLASNPGNGLAFSPGDALVHVNGTNAHTLDQNMGTATVLSPMVYPPLNFPRAGAMDFHPVTSQLYALIKTNDAQAFLGLIRPTDGAVALIGLTQVPALDGLTWGPTTVVAAEPAGPPARLALAPPMPNPTRGAVSIRFALPRPGTVRFDVVDVAGRRVWREEIAVQEAGSHAWSWDGRTLGGGAAPAGIYFVRVGSAAGSASTRFVRLP